MSAADDKNDGIGRLLEAVSNFDASDLHLVAGVPPAFRVNGEIILADEDGLTPEEIDLMWKTAPPCMPIPPTPGLKWTASAVTSTG